MFKSRFYSKLPGWSGRMPLETVPPSGRRGLGRPAAVQWSSGAKCTAGLRTDRQAVHLSVYGLGVTRPWGGFGDLRLVGWLVGWFGLRTRAVQFH